MLDADLIAKCADPALTPAIVEQFVEKAGSPDPLTITVKSGGRLILVPKPKTPDEAMDIVREHVGRAVVRVGRKTEAHEAARMMIEAKIGALPVVGDRGEVVGIVTETDFLEIAERALLGRPLVSYPK